MSCGGEGEWRVGVAVVLGRFFGLRVRVKRVCEFCLLNCAEAMSTSGLLVLGAMLFWAGNWRD